MTEEFNLSDKIIDKKDLMGGEMIYKNDAKEFIKRLKEEIQQMRFKDDWGCDSVYTNILLPKIDKLAGEAFK